MGLRQYVNTSISNNVNVRLHRNDGPRYFLLGTDVTKVFHDGELESMEVKCYGVAGNGVEEINPNDIVRIEQD